METKSHIDLKNVASFVLNLTDVCNINCTYCFEAKTKDKIEEHKNFDDLINTLCDAAQQTKYRKLSVAFYGGEPLSSFNTIKRIVGIVNERVGSESVKYRIASNGILLKGDIKDYLINNNFAIQISLDGPSHVVNVHRKDFFGNGTAHRLQHIVDNVRTFPEIVARMTITPRVAPFFSDSLKYLINIGFDTASRSIKFDFDFTDNWLSEDLDIFHEQCRLASQLLISHYNDGGLAHIDPLDRVFKSQRPSESKCGKGGYCGAGCTAIHVSSQMEYFTCNRLTPSHDISYTDLMLSKNELDLSRLPKILDIIHPGIQRKPECQICPARHYCDQTCPARIHSSSGSFSKISDTHCRLIRETHFLGRRVRAGMLAGASAIKDKFDIIYGLNSTTSGAGTSDVTGF